MRVFFLIVSAFWVAVGLYVIINVLTVNSVGAPGGWYVFGMATFCVAVCSILEGLRKVEQKISRSAG